MALSFVNCFSTKNNSRQGYASVIFQPETLTDSEDEEANHLACDRDVALNTFESPALDGCSYRPEADAPFSRITPSMWPIDMIATFNQPEDAHPPFHVDPYGFLGSEAPSTLTRSPADPLDEIDLRTKWLAHLELTYNTAARSRMKWSDVEKELKRSPSLEQLVQAGLPNSMRAQLWLRFSKGLILSSQHKLLYSEMVEKSKEEISCDLPVQHVLPNNACFMNSQSVGSARLARILRVLKWMQRRGCCTDSQESVNVALITAHLLLICEEEEAFWLVLSITNQLRSLDHQAILKSCLASACPDVDRLLKENDIEISLIAWHWFASLFASLFPDVSLLFRLWDFYFYFGADVLFHLTLGIFDARKAALLQVASDAASLFNLLEDLPSAVRDLKCLKSFLVAGRQMLPVIPELNRSLLSRDAVSSSEVRKTMRDPHDLRNKNIVQTSILVELHEAIVAVGQHFETHDPRFKANFSPDLRENPAEVPVPPSANKTKRLAKALVDFQRNDADELGFKKHDIIRILSERDEDCWVGELNGMTGWFPAQFVLLLDHSDDYAVAGDDRVVMFINDLIRGRLCHVLKQLLSHGLKKRSFMIVHPWSVIEEVAAACVEPDFSSVYAKLLLTKTYRLEDLTRVLTPSEILYKNVSLINQTHDGRPMDIRLRSLVCLALNQKMLHHFWTVICVSQPDLLDQHYHDWSYIRSPVWRLIHAELKLLAQFTFNLNVSAELEPSPASPVSPDGVRDMLVKHHLFSWDV